mgnify:CR=1 FL=1
MKNFLFMCLIAIGCGKCTTSCNKTAATCDASVFTYEVILDTPVPAGSIQITYSDETGTYQQDTSLTSTWTSDVTSVHSVYLAITPGPHFANYVAAGTNLTTTATLNLYRDGDLVETTGSKPFCQQNGATACTGENSISVTHVCVD